MKLLSGLIYILSAAMSLTHAATWGHLTIYNPATGSKTITYEEKNGFAVVEGDIVVGKLSDFKKQGAIVVTKVGGTRWPHGMLPFTIAENMPLITKIAIFQAIDHLQRNTHIEFVELNSTNHGQYSDYIHFMPAGGTECSSYVGRAGGEQAINLAPRCTAMNIVHEIGHALGLWHEQSRADRNNYIKVIWENILDEYRENFNQQLSDGKDLGAYDYGSIMHYGMYAFSKNGEKTIIPLHENITIGQRIELSPKDIDAIDSMYPQIAKERG